MAFAGSGTNVVVRSGQYSNRALDVSPTNKWDGPVLAAGLTGMPYFMAGMNLNTAGTLTAMLDTASGLLTLSGPTGAGFQLKGQWADAAAGSAGQYTHTFTAKGAVTLKSGWSSAT